MHRAACARRHRGTAARRPARTRPLEDRAVTRRRTRSRRRCRVDRTRSSLRHNHATDWRSGSSRCSGSRSSGCARGSRCRLRSRWSSRGGSSRSCDSRSRWSRCRRRYGSGRWRRSSRCRRSCRLGSRCRRGSRNDHRTLRRSRWSCGCSCRSGRRTCDHRTSRGTARNSWRRRRSHNVRSRRACLWNDSARASRLCCRGLLRRCSSRRRCGNDRCSGCCGPRRHSLRGRHHCRTLHYGRGRLGCGLCLLTLENRLQRIAWLRDLRKVKLRLGLDRRPGGRSAAAAAQVTANLLGLIELDGA